MAETAPETDDDFAAGFQCGVTEARAALAVDIKGMLDRYHAELHELRVAIAALAGLPVSVLELRREGRDRPQ